MKSTQQDIKKVGLSELSPVPDLFFYRNSSSNDDDNKELSFSRFFSTPDNWKVIRDVVLQDMKGEKETSILSFGCGTGEGVFSLAIMLKEEKLLFKTDFKVIEPSPLNLELTQSRKFDLDSLNYAQRNYVLSGGYLGLENYVELADSGFLVKNLFPIQYFKEENSSDRAHLVMISEEFLSQDEFENKIMLDNIINRCCAYGYLFLEQESKYLEEHPDFLRIQNTTIYKKVG